MMMLSPLLALILAAADEPRPKPGAPAASAATPAAPWSLTLVDAIREGLRNSPVVRVAEGPQTVAVTPGREVGSANVVISPADGQADEASFRSAIMAHVRSVEQTYWALSMAQTALWSREVALKLGQEVLRREKAEAVVGRGNPADIAEAEQQVENFKLNLVTATADLMTVERQLRNLLGANADPRRIVAVTPPTLAKISPEWEPSIAAMIAAQPDIEAARRALADAEFRATLSAAARPDHQPDEADRAAVAKRKDVLQAVVHRATHTLARFFLEADANFKQVETAQRLNKASRDRLAAQQAFYDEGRVSIDRLLDAVGQFGNAVAQEAQFVASYNTSLAAFEEARGTILAYEGIALAIPPRPVKGDDKARPVDGLIAPTSHQEAARPDAP